MLFKSLPKYNLNVFLQGFGSGNTENGDETTNNNALLDRHYLVDIAIPHTAVDTMLKSTHRLYAPSTAQQPPLPPGWTEHKAPTGHTYYYNAETKQSTYTRPTAAPADEPLQIDYGATEPDHVVRASMQAMEAFHKNNQHPGAPGHFTGGRSYQDHSRRRGNQGDRPKSKAPIPNCAPWVLVKTKLGRRFVHNTETKQSLWKFPQDVMMAVIEMDRLEWEANKRAEESQQSRDSPSLPGQGETTDLRPRDDEAGAKAESTTPADSSRVGHTHNENDYDSDSYEEVEVTDDEDEEGAGQPKRPRLSGETPPPGTAPDGPVELTEDDIAYQLAMLEEDYADDDGAALEAAQARELEGEAEGDDEGLPLTDTDNIALFRSLLDESGISPYSTFERLIEDLSIVEDPRWVSLPNTTRRKEAFVAWSKDRIAELQARKEAERRSRDPRVEYLRFLQRHATPKLYWPEFKRKFKKEPELRDVAMQDKEREKLYREFVAKLKLSDTERRKELVSLLKSVDKGSLHRDMDLRDLPNTVLRDLRFYVLDAGRRDDLVKTFLETQQ
ncbi:hypothetical protein HRR83_005022 [Exophiala dermatitidis]|nr:hypothetical protein HRR75_004403 [Exophiala dermatitidis]KAJ4517065.1 hypothetical protein HRR74_004815 [Exophiala dermatitidis]KAJ4519758.1 hypothetical protein HRR73_003818 [Exophiala dermatitidis]KAJ4534439.1 hypothetical protein HRR76_006365 [Exophiala dermatitidis]KAJ4541339.1 hypothetical protein HRR77_006137 [Exophiala dermatitidis]